MPPRVSWPWIVVAVSVWVVVAVLPHPLEEAPIPAGPFRGEVTLLGEVVDGPFGPYAIAAGVSGVVLADFDEVPEAGRGDRLEVVGSVRGGAGTAGGRSYGAVLRVREVETIEPSRFLLHRAGRLIAETVISRLYPLDDGRALLSGFLIGDTSSIAESDIEAMRRSGLAHFVAVSGSNVALFLGLLTVAAGPLALGPRRRAVVGLAALPVYVAATRFEPSVMRAAFMAGVALVGRLADVVLEAWQLLALAVAALVLIDPALTDSVGFQLSVSATAGVLIGARWPLSRRYLRPVAVTVGAQIAVAPLLLVHFSTVPLLSPVVNLVAAPLVATATVLGAIGVAGVTPMVGPASFLAEMVLVLSRGAAPWPQLSAVAFGGVVTATFVLWVAPRLRRMGAWLAATLVVASTSWPGSVLAPGEVVVLDVGQGDAILISGGEGRFALVDGGPDEAVLIGKLREYGVRSLELVVLTHVHADHAAGLKGVIGSVPVRQVWMDLDPHSSAAAEELVALVGPLGLPVRAPPVGTRFDLGSVSLVVEGPLRRYDSPNDQSIVLTVIGAQRSMLLSGDIETHAQADLTHLRADVLKVPHQGADTSDPRWLVEVGSQVAVISVGPNQFGHPVEWVIDALDDTNRVLRTDELGDVTVDLHEPG